MRYRLRMAILGAGLCASAFALAAGSQAVTTEKRKHSFPQA
jgi:hypothetical protein